MMLNIPSQVINFCMRYANSSQGWTNQLLGIPFLQFTAATLDLEIKGTHDLSLKCLVLKYLSPIWGSPVTCAMLSSVILMVRFPIVSLSPSNEWANSKATPSQNPSNFSKKPIHCFCSKICIQSLWIFYVTSFPGSHLDTILPSFKSKTLKYFHCL